MLNLATGKAFTRRDSIKGLAAIIAAGCAPSIAKAAGGLVRGAAARAGMMMRYSARNYVQDGLIAMWDGIENAGWGTHDASATTWKDLIGVRNFILNTSSGRSSFDENSFYMADINSGNNVWAAYAPTGLLKSQLCQEICGYDLSNSMDVFNCGTRYKGFYIAYTSAQGGTSVSLYKLSKSKNDRFTFTVNYESDSDTAAITSMAYNGETKAMLTGATSNYYQNDSYMSLGGRYNVTDYGGSGHIHCLRIYNRALTAAEIAHNYAVDKARFNLP